MDRLRKVINQYGRWTEIALYTERIEAYLATDFSLSLENAKALLETIGKEICTCKDIVLESAPNTNTILRKLFRQLAIQVKTWLLRFLLL